MVKW